MVLSLNFFGIGGSFVCLLSSRSSSLLFVFGGFWIGLDLGFSFFFFFWCAHTFSELLLMKCEQILDRKSCGPTLGICKFFMYYQPSWSFCFGNYASVG